MVFNLSVLAYIGPISIPDLLRSLERTQASRIALTKYWMRPRNVKVEPERKLPVRKAFAAAFLVNQSKEGLDSDFERFVLL